VTDAAGPAPPLAPNYRVAFAILRVLFDGYITTHVSGHGHLPPIGTPAIVAANHTSALDVFAVGHALDRPARFLAKVEATRIPLLGPYLLSLGAIPTLRNKRDTDALRQALAALERGELLGLAPEGTRSRDGRMGAYDPGFVWMATRTGACVVPCVIHGAHRLMPKGARWPRRGELWVRFGSPIRFDAEGRRVPRVRLEVLAGEVRARTLEILGDLARESGVPSPALQEGDPRA
jgi:1-acyl-sn-glycerol-3-phosphate acyltransferase